MITSIKQRVASLDPRTHLMSRIWLQMVALIVIVVLALMALLHLLLRSTFLNRALEEAAVSTSVATTALRDNYDQTVLGFVEICGTEEFEDLLADIVQADPHDQTQLNISLQSTLQAMVSRNVLADSVMLVNRDGLCFQPLSQRAQA